MRAQVRAPVLVIVQDASCIFASSLGEALVLRDRVLQDMVRLGWFVGLVKSLVVSAQKVLYLGFEFASSPVPHMMVPTRPIVAALHCMHVVVEFSAGAVAAGIRRSWGRS